MRKPRRPALKLALFGAAGGVLAMWFWLGLPCVPRTVTGLICPGCGMSRAWLALLRGELAQALRHHPMFWSVPALALYIWFDGVLFSNRRLNNWVLALLVGGFVGCYLIRLICFLDGSLAI